MNGMGRGLLQLLVRGSEWREGKRKGMEREGKGNPLLIKVSSQKRLQLLGEFVPQTPYQCVCI